MCIFSQSVRHVSKTRVYARIKGERQHLVYEMRLASETDLAMILPLPTKTAGEDQVSFVALSEYEGFFEDVERCFPRPVSRGLGDLAMAGRGGAPLVVHRVGAFDASFVPGRADFRRLDPRFRLADDVWRQLPAYSDFGFAVFQLRAGDAGVHPMALSFATRNPDAIYFPTTHVHDGTVHPVAQFDHSLYAQGERESRDWVRGSVLPSKVMKFGNFLISDRTKGLVDAHAPIAGRDLYGAFPNEDIWVPVSRGA
jgi:hypothetical protein